MEVTVPLAYFQPMMNLVQNEVYLLETKDGNPVFDFQTPRKVFIRSIYQDFPIPASSACPAIGNFHGKRDAGDEILWEYIIDENTGNIILDNYGQPLKKQTEDQENPGKVKSQKWVLGGYEIELEIPRDNYKIKQILRWPRNASVEYIDGLSTKPVDKKFYIYDPDEEEKNEKRRREIEERAVSYSKSINDESLFGYACYLDLLQYIKPKRGKGGENVYTNSDLRYTIESFARENPKLFLEETKQNGSLNKNVLIALAIFHRVLSINEEGYYYYPLSGQAIWLGASEEQVFAKFNENESLRHDVIKRSKYNEFRPERDIVIKEEDTPIISSNSGFADDGIVNDIMRNNEILSNQNKQREMSQLKEQNKALEEKMKQMEEMLHKIALSGGSLGEAKSKAESIIPKKSKVKQ